MITRYVLKLRDSKTPRYLVEARDDGMLVVTDSIGGIINPQTGTGIVLRAMLFATEDDAWLEYERYKKIPVIAGYHHARLQAVPVSKQPA